MAETLLDFQRLMQAYQHCERRIQEGGYTVRIETDFNLIRQDIEAAGKPLSPFFWDRYFTWNGINGHCVVLEKDGAGLAYLCSQVIDCGSLSLHDVYTRRLSACYSHDPNARLDPSWVCEPMLEFSGVGVYSGDAVTHDDLRAGGRSLVYLSLISRLSNFLAMLFWRDAQWIVGTVRKRDAQRGLAWTYGARSIDPMAEHWLNLPEGRLTDYCLCSSRRRDILWQAKNEMRNHP